MANPNVKQSHCKRGHRLSGYNLRDTHGRRSCRICGRITTLKAYKRRHPGYEPAKERWDRLAKRTECIRGHSLLDYGVQYANGKRRCKKCSALTMRVRKQLVTALVQNQDVSPLIESAKEHLGIDYRSWVEKVRKHLEGESQWQTSKRKLTAAWSLNRKLNGGGRQSAWPWPIEESKPAKTSPR